MTQFGTPKACDFVQPLFHYLITPLLYDITKYKIKCLLLIEDKVELEMNSYVGHHLNSYLTCIM